MYLPTATYRIQLSTAFPFKALKAILPYLHELGITTIYASPIFKARPGSEHGYDIVDPQTLNPEIGTLEEFRDLNATLKHYGMSWLQDIVPNHMAYHADNGWLWDVLEKGPYSQYYQYFDIDWCDSDPAYHGKVMAPFLGEPLEKALSNGEIKLEFSEEGFHFKYYEHTYPLSCASYFILLKQAATYMEQSDTYQELVNAFEGYEAAAPDQRKWGLLKKQLYQKVQDIDEVKKAIDQALAYHNENTGQLKQLLDQQYFHLCHWKTTDQHINYRRFFTINDLICLRMEEEKVFEDYHQMIQQLWNEDLIHGLRIDHVDGLFDPEGYLKRLRKMTGPDGYLIVEKILEWSESLPADWPIQGTSGYEFLALFNTFYTDPENHEAFSRLYETVAPNHADYDALSYKQKHFMLQERLGGELDNLLQLLQKLDVPLGQEELKKALSAFLAAFPVYRTYINKWPIRQRDQNTISLAFELAHQQAPEIKPALDKLKKVLVDHEVPEEQKDELLYFLMRCQQVTSPLAAKGIEDTTFYVYNRLIAHNEVGDSPHVFGLTAQQFHEALQQRMTSTPHALNTTATHDTKRGEDVRTCLNVLSEMPEAWAANTREWIDINQKFKSQLEGKPVPNTNEEYFLYQTLVGVVPLEGEIDQELTGRIQKYMVKALREAKIHSSWSEPDESYEQKVNAFIEAILQDNEFKKAFLPFLKTVSHYGAIYSLAQISLKVTAPGIPDIYQGTELWDLSMVDPDNRRPVDYDLRTQYLKELGQKGQDDLPALIKELKMTLKDGRIKLFTLHKCLDFRKTHPDIFAYGQYIPLKIEGENARHVTGFARQYKEEWCIVLIPRLLTTLIPEGCFPEDEAVWEDTYVHLPEEAPKAWKHVFTGKKYQLSKRFPLAEIYDDFPIILLHGEN